MKGYKTYTGIALIVLGFFGWTEIVTPENLDSIANNMSELIGIFLAIYGRYKAGK